MHNITKALLLSLVIAAPVAIFTSAVQAKTVVHKTVIVTHHKHHAAQHKS
ncbi:MAG TPA: hypothetical protein V6C85_11700 [Allocoleopsis sp.]